ncbi:hypothetical protein HOP50_17g80680 [Chloropicon primus]|uniref:PHD-type domain-containing protein n=1 Tax=Chloropicon primus TaxID=1764295 RepID=A0A5B8MZM5_9CHLO|nr:hypothetical protein A3770_17p80440 [Chloropicon primus]UPR04723.1 hypothetical protein HOP50_17g80680 [Chloropicon primus]|eukprot:QDZ25526.1 hypothetical protein A3770_17p80440 [Chloropicon primus]
MRLDASASCSKWKHKAAKGKSRRAPALSKEEEESIRVAKQLQKSINGLRSTRRKKPVEQASTPKIDLRQGSRRTTQRAPSMKDRKAALKELHKNDMDEYSRQFLHCRSLGCENYPPGTHVFARLGGHCPWPGVMWQMALCPSSIQKELFVSYAEGHVLVRTYGDRKVFWCKHKLVDLVTDKAQLDPEHSVWMKKCKAWARRKQKFKVYKLLLDDLKEISRNPQVECHRLVHEQKKDTNPNDEDICAICSEDDAILTCERCTKSFHDICLNPPIFIDEDDKDAHGNIKYPPWQCPCCGFLNRAENDDYFVRMGLTPDWLIHEAAFNVFQLEQPTIEMPYIKGLLDPCTNSKETPNIPAQVLYDKHDDGLDSKNSWKGYHIILNPEYKAKILWRFINRAIDEVENDNCPAIIVVCRNSTDAAYFHRLTPYPRILLRRKSIHFKDYDSTPIGFGIVVFCICKVNCKLYMKRFYDSFSQYGEINIPIDRALITHPVFYSLVDRLQMLARETQRDHWIQCDACKQWRLVPFELLLKTEKNPDAKWSCSDAEFLKKQDGCKTPLTTLEAEAQEWHLYSIKSNNKALIGSSKSNRNSSQSSKKDNAAAQETEDDEQEKEESRSEVEEMHLKHVLPLKKIGRLVSGEKGDQALTSLELARTARIAVNHKLMEKLGLHVPAKIGKQLAALGNNNGVGKGKGKVGQGGEGEGKQQVDCLPVFIESQKALENYKRSLSEFQTMQAELAQERMRVYESLYEKEQELSKKYQQVTFCKNKISDLNQE